MKCKLGNITVLFALTCVAAVGSTRQEMDAAGKSGKVAFLLLYDQTAVQVDQARQIIVEAVKKNPGTVKIELNRSDAANAEIVSKYRLAEAPVPLILVMTPYGIVTGGKMASALTSEKLAGMVPSPKKIIVVQAFADGKVVLVTFSRKGMKIAENVIASGAAACQKLDGKAVHITIDLGDPKEALFIEEMKIDKAAVDPVTIVTNVKGEVVGTFHGRVQVSDLIASAKK